MSTFDLESQIKPLSLRARIAISLHLFADYCKRRQLNHLEIDRFKHHMWDFFSLEAKLASFDDWINSKTTLTYVGLGDEFPLEIVAFLEDSKVSLDEFRAILVCTTEILYSSLYGAADEVGSRKYLVELTNFVENIGAELPDLSYYSNSKWTDQHGWGNTVMEPEILK